MVSWVIPVQQVRGVPLFHIENEARNLVCPGCRLSVLIIGYREENFVGLTIRCGECGHVTSTPGLEAGEILPKRIEVLDSTLLFSFTSTRTVDPRVAVTSRSEVVGEQMLTHPRNPSEHFHLTRESLKQLEVIYDQLSGGILARQIKASLNPHRLKRYGTIIRESPFVWSCGRVRRMLRLESPLLPVTDEADAAALTNLEVFHHFAHMWGHHPRIKAVQNDFSSGSGFHHTMIVFATLYVFFERGIRVTLAFPVGNGVRTYDLYTKFDANTKTALEIKVPQKFTFPHCLHLTAQSVARVVTDALKASKGQLGSTNPGILVLSLTFIMREVKPLLEEGLRLALDAVGHRHLSVAGVMILRPRFDKPFSDVPLANPFGYGCVFQANKKFIRDNLFAPLFATNT